MLRLSHERGFVDHGWLQSFHTFSFSSYYDPQWMGYRKLRVINEDTVQPDNGFPTHPHKDMEILTYVYEGTVRHKDSMGNTTEIHAGEFQIMSAGTGITHSEFNPSSSEVLRLIQIWIEPNRLNIIPRYDQKLYGPKELENKLKLIVSPDSRDGSMLVNQDVNVYTGLLKKDFQLQKVLDPKRYYWLQVVEGNVRVNDQILNQGDAFTLENSSRLDLNTQADSNLILFDLS